MIYQFGNLCSSTFENINIYYIVNILLSFSHLRYDTLAQILTLGNIHAGSKIIVFETCAGLVLGSVMERMGGNHTFL